MSSLVIISTIVGAFVIAWTGVGLFIRWSLRREIFDVPNERSSHSVPTPRGGGLVLVIVALVGYVAACLITHTNLSYGYLAGALMIAIVSWLDDLVSVPFWARLAVHITGSAVVIADLGYWDNVFIPSIDINIPLGNILGVVVTAGWVIWLINAYNFMDGIDGIAGIQALVAGIAWSLLASWLGADSISLFAAILASATAGFLAHNWAPARIFMGDVGSAFLGFTLAALPLLTRAETRSQEQILPAAAILFVWFFLFDSVLTFLRRLVNRQRVWEAHREHIYQRMVIAGWGHSAVSSFYGIVAALLCGSTVLAVVLSGIFPLLALFSLIIPSVALLYWGRRKNR